MGTRQYFLSGRNWHRSGIQQYDPHKSFGNKSFLTKYRVPKDSTTKLVYRHSERSSKHTYQDRLDGCHESVGDRAQTCYLPPATGKCYHAQFFKGRVLGTPIDTN